MPKCVSAHPFPPAPDFFISGYMHGLSVNGQSSCEGEKSELVSGLLEGLGVPRRKQDKWKHLVRVSSG